MLSFIDGYGLVFLTDQFLYVIKLLLILQLVIILPYIIIRFEKDWISLPRIVKFWLYQLPKYFKTNKKGV